MKRKFDKRPIDILMGQKLVEARKKLEMQPRDFAKKINVTLQQLQKYEDGTDMFPLSVLERLEKKCGIYLPRRTYRKISKLRSQDKEHGETPEELFEVIENIWEDMWTA